MSLLLARMSSPSIDGVRLMRRLTQDGELLPGQVGAARVLLGWSQTDLAHAAGLARSTVAAFENATRPAYASVRAALRRTLEEAGVEFVFAKDGSYGVVLVGGGQRVRGAVKGPS